MAEPTGLALLNYVQRQKPPGPSCSDCMAPVQRPASGAVPRRCPDCTREYNRARQRQRYQDMKAKGLYGGSVPTLTCKDCGRPMWANKGALPQGQATCQPCRRAANPSRVKVECRAGCGRMTVSRTGVCKDCTRLTKPPKPRRIRRPDGRSTAAWQKARAAVLANATHCWICKQPLRFDVKAPHPLSPSVDHVIPLQHDGPLLDPHNLRPCHLRCNVRRGNLTRRGLDIEDRPLNRKQCPQCDAWFIDDKRVYCSTECKELARTIRARRAARARRRNA